LISALLYDCFPFIAFVTITFKSPSETGFDVSNDIFDSFISISVLSLFNVPNSFPFSANIFTIPSSPNNCTKLSLFILIFLFTIELSAFASPNLYPSSLITILSIMLLYPIFNLYSTEYCVSSLLESLSVFVYIYPLFISFVPFISDWTNEPICFDISNFSTDSPFISFPFTVATADISDV